MTRKPSARIVVGLLIGAAGIGCSSQDSFLLKLLPPALVNAPRSVRIDADQVYAEIDGRTLRYDLYRPDGVAGPLPLVVLVHGGSWRSGSRRDMAEFSYDLAAQGYAAATIDYRLANGKSVVFPMPVADVLTAVRFLRDHASDLNADPQRVAVLGVSAGAHLSLLAGVAADDSVFDSARPSGETAGVRAVVAIEGPTDFTVDPASAASFQIKIVENFLGKTLDSLDASLLAAASPAHYARADGPPVLVIHGDADSVVPVSQARLLVGALNTAGQVHEYHEIAGMDHLPGAWWPGPFVQAYRQQIFAFLAASL